MKAYNFFKIGIVLLILVALLTGCGTNTKTNDNDTSRTNSSTIIPEQTDQTDFPLKDIAGLWVMQEIETEGDRISSELAGLSVELLLREDSTADYIELTAAGESTEYLNLIVDGDGDGRLDFSYDSELAHHECVITKAEGDTLELSSEWSASDKTAGGSTMYFQRGELDERGRKLYPAELEKLTEKVAFDFSEYGFFVTTYDRPEEIDWSEVCCGSSSIRATASGEVIAAYREAYGDYYGDLIMVGTSDLADFVFEKTQTPYSEARKPLSMNASWKYLSEYDLWCMDYYQDEMQEIIFTDGYASGNEYYLYYIRSDFDNFINEREFVMHCYIRDMDWQHISNLPADAPSPVTLLNIEFFDTKEEAQQLRGVTDFIEVTKQSWDDPDGWSWAVITAQTDNVRYIVNRTDPSVSYDLFGVSVPGDNITSGVLNTGESFALYVNQPWTPAVLLTATKDDYWGEFVFGEDNGLNFDNSVIRYVTGHDLQGEGRGCSPVDEHQLARFLMDGDWVYLDEAGEFRAAIKFENYQWMSILKTDEAYPVHFQYERSDSARANEAPDLLRLEKGYAFASDWNALPYWYEDTQLGYYSISAVQMDGEQLLYLTQANNGDGALGYLLTGSDKKDIVLHRYRGTARFENQS